MNRLDIEGVAKAYRGVTALHPLGLTLEPGITGLLGPNGAGKSTLMRIIATVTTPSAGSIRWNGADVRRSPDALRRQLGYLPQDAGVYPQLTADEFLRYVAALKGLPARAAAEQIDALIDRLNLGSARSRPLGGFSGGMRQRVGIAQALLGDPQLIVVDEPTVGLDPEERVRFRQLIGELGRDRVVLLSTHIVSDVEAAASRIVILDDGRIRADGTPAGVIGGALWFFIVTALVAAPLGAWTSGKPSAMLDPLGLVPLVAGMAGGVVAAFPGTRIQDIAIGSSDPVTRTFAWHGMTWSASIAGERVAWFAVALAIVGLASLAFDRFAHARTTSARAWRFPVGRIVPDIAGMRLLRAELAVLAGDAGLWWPLAAIACGIAGAFVPSPALVSAVLPVALVLPLALYGSLGTRDRATGVEALVLSAPGAAWRTIAARVLAAGIVGCIPLAGALARYPALAIVPFAAAALAIVLGRLCGTPRPFEAISLGVWYLGALNHAPFFDLAADALAAPATFAGAGACITLIAMLVARAQLIVWRPHRASAPA